MDLARQIKDAAFREGFSLVGICRATTPPGWERFQEWLDAGYAGEMSYLNERRSAYRHPEHVLAGVRSLVMLGWNYLAPWPTSPPAESPAPSPSTPQASTTGRGRIARYAWSETDYHDLLHDKLKRLAGQLKNWSAGALVRGVVDTAPLLEREFAQLAGLGWIGKNTLLIHKGTGSWFFLAALLTDLELKPDDSWTSDHCGTCTACLDACPTQAFPAPYVLDATRCISYLTIELREAVPTELREGLGDWVFGCDICQEVCPWNRRAPTTDDPAMKPRDDLPALSLADLFSLDDDGFRRRFRRTPLWRSKRRGLLRNAAYALGNQRAESSVPALIRGLADVEPLVRGASAWGLGQIGGMTARSALESRRSLELDPLVLLEIEAAWKATDRLTNQC